MRKFITYSILGLFVFVLSNSLNAQNILTGQWLFNPGDDTSWQSIGFDDSKWNPIDPTQLWESQGYLALDGIAWYRIHFKAPLKYKKEAQLNGGMLLRLARIDDADQTYFNGKFVGQSGEFPPNFATKWDLLREYKIPFELINWDAENVVAVRVYDHSGNGGMYSDPLDLMVIGYAEKIKITHGLKESDCLIKNSSNINIPVIIDNKFNESFQGMMELKINNEFNEEVFRFSQKANILKSKSNTIIFNQVVLKPGFYKAVATFSNENTRINGTFKFGVEPEKVISPTTLPADFDAYWNRAKNELKGIDPQYKVTLIDSLCNISTKMYLVEMRSLGNVLIKGWLSVPVKEGKYPSILHVHGYSSEVKPEWVCRDSDLVAFGLTIRGHGHSKDNFNPGFPGYLLYNIQDKETYVYRSAYMDCVRAMDFICSQPQVDTSRIVVEGASQGGALTIAVAALDQRVKAAIPMVPFLSDFPDYFKVANWPASEFANYVANHPEVGWTKVFETLNYIDIKNLAPKIKVPVLMEAGLCDDVCPLHINFAAYNNLSGPKSYIVYPKATHSVPEEFQIEKMKWIREQFKMGKK